MHNAVKAWLTTWRLHFDRPNGLLGLLALWQCGFLSEQHHLEEADPFSVMCLSVLLSLVARCGLGLLR